MINAIIAPHIRWMIRRDMPDVLAIENESFEFPWDEDAFIRVLRQRNCIGMSAEHGQKIVGYMIYELYSNRIHLLTFAVARAFRHHGVGAAMVNKLKSKLSAPRKNRIVLETRETNMGSLIFFKSQGFLATNVLRGFYDDTAEDAISMVYRFKE